MKRVTWVLLTGMLWLAPLAAAAQEMTERGYVISSDTTLGVVMTRSPMTDSTDSVIIYQLSDSTQNGWRFQITASCFDSATTGRMTGGDFAIGMKPEYDGQMGYYFAPDSIRYGRAASTTEKDVLFFTFRVRVPPAALVVSRGWKGKTERGFGLTEADAPGSGPRAVFGEVLKDTSATTVLYIQALVGSAPVLSSNQMASIRRYPVSYVARFRFTPEKKRWWRKSLRQCHIPWTGR